MSNLHHLQISISDQVFCQPTRPHMPPRYSARRHVLSGTAHQKIEWPGLWAKLLGILLLAHFGRKLEVNGVKASWTNVLYSSPILVASATNVACADLA